MKTLTIKLNKGDGIQRNREFIYNYKNGEIIKDIPEFDLTKAVEKHLLNQFDFINDGFKNELYLTIDFNMINEETAFYISQY